MDNIRSLVTSSPSTMSFPDNVHNDLNIDTTINIPITPSNNNNNNHINGNGFNGINGSSNGSNGSNGISNGIVGNSNASNDTASSTPTHIHSMQTRKSDHQLKMDSLKIAQQKSELMSAIQSLNSYHAFRAQNDRSFRERALEEQVKQEIKKPLEDALEEIKVLNSRVSRRDVYIQGLRRLVALESISIAQLQSASIASTSVGSMSTKEKDKDKTSVMQSNFDNERVQIFDLYDNIDQLEDENRQLHHENERLHQRVAFYTQQRKDHYLEMEQQHIVTKESVRQLEKERDYLLAISNQRENIIERVTNELVRTREDYQLAKKVEAASIERTATLEKEKEKFQQETMELQQQLQEKTKLFSDLQVLSTAARDKLMTLTTENIELRKRYDRMVIELDQIVASINKSNPQENDAHDHKGNGRRVRLRINTGGNAGDDSDDNSIPESDWERKSRGVGATTPRGNARHRHRDSKSSSGGAGMDTSEGDVKLVETLAAVQAELTKEKSQVVILNQTLTGLQSEKESLSEKIKHHSTTVTELKDSLRDKEIAIADYEHRLSSEQHRMKELSADWEKKYSQLESDTVKLQAKDTVWRQKEREWEKLARKLESEIEAEREKRRNIQKMAREQRLDRPSMVSTDQNHSPSSTPRTMRAMSFELPSPSAEIDVDPVINADTQRCDSAGGSIDSRSRSRAGSIAGRSRPSPIPGSPIVHRKSSLSASPTPLAQVLLAQAAGQSIAVDGLDTEMLDLLMKGLDPVGLDVALQSSATNSGDDAMDLVPFGQRGRLRSASDGGDSDYYQPELSTYSRSESKPSSPENGVRRSMTRPQPNQAAQSFNDSIASRSSRSRGANSPERGVNLAALRDEILAEQKAKDEKFRCWAKQLLDKVIILLKTENEKSIAPASSDECGPCKFQVRNTKVLEQMYSICASRNELVAQLDQKSDQSTYRELLCCIDALLMVVVLQLSVRPKSSPEDERVLNSLVSHIERSFTSDSPLELMLLWELNNEQSWDRVRDRLSGMVSIDNAGLAYGNQVNNREGSIQSSVQSTTATTCVACCCCKCHLSSPSNTPRPRQSIAAYMNRTSPARVSRMENVDDFLDLQETNTREKATSAQGPSATQTESSPFYPTKSTPYRLDKGASSHRASQAVRDTRHHPYVISARDSSPGEDKIEAKLTQEVVKLPSVYRDGDSILEPRVINAASPSVPTDLSTRNAGMDDFVTMGINRLVGIAAVGADAAISTTHAAVRAALQSSQRDPSPCISRSANSPPPKRVSIVPTTLRWGHQLAEPVSPALQLSVGSAQPTNPSPQPPTSAPQHQKSSSSRQSVAILRDAKPHGEQGPPEATSRPLDTDSLPSRRTSLAVFGSPACAAELRRPSTTASFDNHETSRHLIGENRKFSVSQSHKEPRMSSWQGTSLQSNKLSSPAPPPTIAENSVSSV